MVDLRVLSGDEVTDEPLGWPVRSHTLLGGGLVSDFVRDEVETPAGEVMKRDYLLHPGAVGIIALDDAERVVVVRQLRHPVGFRLIEPPAGLIDAGETSWLAVAQRELAEEVALAADRWDVLVDICSTPGACEETLRIFLARDLSPTERPEGFVLEGEEAHMTWDWQPREELVAAVLSGAVESPSLVSGILALETARLRGTLDDLRPGDAPWPIRER